MSTAGSSRRCTARIGWTWVASPVWVQIVNVASESTRPFGKFVKNDEYSRT